MESKRLFFLNPLRDPLPARAKHGLLEKSQHQTFPLEYEAKRFFARASLQARALNRRRICDALEYVTFPPDVVSPTSWPGRCCYAALLWLGVGFKPNCLYDAT